MDIMMPGIDGLETARRVIEIAGCERTRLVATSASAFAHEQREYSDAGFHDFLAKPIRIERVFECLGALHAGGEAATIAPAMEISHEPEEIEAIPHEMRVQLAEAAQLCSITDLKTCVTQLELLEFPPRKLVTTLKRCIRHYDLAGVQRIVGCEAAAAEVR
jgi:CheY-like chemotaxis protein